MKKIRASVLSAVLSAAVLMNTFTVYASAAGDISVTTAPVTVSDIDMGVTDDELLLGYFENSLYGVGGGISTFAIGGSSSLRGDSRTIYNTLKSMAQNIAAGNDSTASYEFDFTYTCEEIGLTGTINQSTLGTAVRNMTDSYDISFVVGCLLRDCPYEFYWFDKSAGYQYSSSASVSGSQVTIKYTVSFKVGSEYRGSSEFTVDTSVTSAASSAASNAQAIVSSNSGKSDLERLKAYKDKICELVSYDNDAADNINTSGYVVDPWQVIHVFDKDSSTNVVCEGYAKAFQYLCDLDGGLTCYSVSGTMSGGTGSGPHMWNIVTYEEKNYLVDVTNCDDGSIGSPDELFMKDMTKVTSCSKYSRKIGSTTITFTYDDDTKEYFGDYILNLDSDYVNEGGNAVEAEGSLFTNEAATSAVAATGVDVYVNGAKLKGSTPVDYKSTALYAKTEADGKYVAVITTTNRMPTVTNGKVVADKAAKDYAKASVKGKKITVTAGKRTGTAYLWLLDIDNKRVVWSASAKINVKGAASAVAIYDTASPATGAKPLKAGVVGSQSTSEKFYFSSTIKDASKGVPNTLAADLEYTVVADSKNKVALVVNYSPGNSFFTVTAPKLNPVNNKIKTVSGKVIVTNVQSGKKATITITVGNDILATEASIKTGYATLIDEKGDVSKVDIAPTLNDSFIPSTNKVSVAVLSGDAVFEKTKLKTAKSKSFSAKLQSNGAGYRIRITNSGAKQPAPAVVYLVATNAAKKTTYYKVAAITAGGEVTAVNT